MTKKKRLPKLQTASGTLDNYYQRLVADGWKEIGSGYKAKAYTKDGVVLKVACDDAGYDDFLRVALANQDNPYYPKIYSVDRYKNVEYKYEWSEQTYKHKRVTVVLMEKLQSAKEAGETTINSDWGTIHNPVADKLRTLGRLVVNGKIEINESELEVAEALAELFSKHREDLHAENLMYRGKQPVVTDPVVGRGYL